MEEGALGTPPSRSNFFITTRKRSCGKVMFSEVFVCLRGGVLSRGGVHPQYGGAILSTVCHPQQGCSMKEGCCEGTPAPLVNKQAVCILLECILVFIQFLAKILPNNSVLPQTRDAPLRLENPGSVAGTSNIVPSHYKLVKKQQFDILVDRLFLFFLCLDQFFKIF